MLSCFGRCYWILINTLPQFVDSHLSFCSLVMGPFGLFDIRGCKGRGGSGVSPGTQVRDILLLPLKSFLFSIRLSTVNYDKLLAGASQRELILYNASSNHIKRREEGITKLKF